MSLAVKQRNLNLIFGLLIPSACLDAQDFRSYAGATNTVWESPTNWNPNLVPDSISEGARIGNGAIVQVGASHVIAALEITSGSLTLNQMNELRTSSLLISGAGVLSGPGSLIVEQSGSFADSSGFSMSNLLFRNNGTIQVLNSFSMASDSCFENANTLEFFDGVSLGIAPGSPLPTPGPIKNTGFLRKSAGAGSVTIGMPVENENDIFSAEGEMIFSQNIQQRGQIRTESGGEVSLRGGGTLFDGSSVSSKSHATNPPQVQLLADKTDVGRIVEHWPR